MSVGYFDFSKGDNVWSATYSKTIPAKVMGADAKGTSLPSAVMKVWRGASLQSLQHPENVNSRKILAL